MLTAKDLHNLLPEFISYLNSNNSSRSTIKNYASDLRRVLEKLPGEVRLDKDNLAKAFEALKADFSESSIRRFSFSLKAFTNWLNSKGYNFTPIILKQNNLSEDIKVSPVESYVEFIKIQGAPENTTRQYKSDLISFFSWLKPKSEELSKRSINRVSRFDINRYISFLKGKQVSQASINRYLYSLKGFFNFQKEDIIYETNPVTVSAKLPGDKKSFWQKVRPRKPRWWHAYRGHPASDYLNWTALAVLTLLVGLSVYSKYYAPKPIDLEALKNGLVLGATAPPRILSFQGRLTNPGGTPIVSATNVVFKIYDARTAGNLKWTSKTWSVTPDQNGIFSVCLGGQDTTDDCLLNAVADTVIPANLFTDNPSLYLGITVSSDAEATPRQRIASSTYALNAGALNSSFSSATNNDFGNSISATNAATSGVVTINGIVITPTGTATAGINTINLVNFATPITPNSNNFYGLNFATGYTDILRYNGTQLISGAGVTGPGLTLALGSSTITGTLGITSGGTNTGSIGGAGTIVYSNGTSYAFSATTVSSGQCLLSGTSGTGQPTWNTCPGGSTRLDQILAATLTPPTIDSTSFAQTWNWSGLTTQTAFTLDSTATGLTTGGILALGSATTAYNHLAANTGSVQSITFKDTTNGAFASTTNGLLVSPTINITAGAATKSINAISINPTFTACTPATCTVNGLNIAAVTYSSSFNSTAINVGSGWTTGLAIGTDTSGTTGVALSSPATNYSVGNIAGTNLSSTIVRSYSASGSRVDSGKLIDLDYNITNNSTTANLTFGIANGGSVINASRTLTCGATCAGLTAQTSANNSSAFFFNDVAVNPSGTITKAANFFTIGDCIFNTSGSPQCSGTITDSQTLLNLQQNYSGSTGTVLKITDNGTGKNSTTIGTLIDATLSGSPTTGTTNLISITGGNSSGTAQNAILINTLFGGTAADTAINIGTGWDNLISSSVFSVTGNGVGTFAAGLTVTTGAVNITGTSGSINLSVGTVNITGTSGSIDFSASSGTFKTGSGAIALNGDVTIASGKALTFTGGASNFDQSASSGTFKTGSGAVSINGTTTVATGKNLANISGTGTLTWTSTTNLGVDLNVDASTSLSPAIRFTASSGLGCCSASIVNAIEFNVTNNMTNSHGLDGFSVLYNSSSTTSNPTGGNSVGKFINQLSSTTPVAGSLGNLLLLDNLDTTASGTTTATNGLLIQSTGNSGITNGINISGANITTGLNFTGTFTNYIVAPNFSVNNAGTVSIATGQSYTGVGTVTLSSGGSSGLTIDSASGRTTIATGDFLSTSLAGVSGAGSGDIWYDSTALKYKINENGTTKTLCNLTDLGCGAGGGSPFTSTGGIIDYTTATDRLRLRIGATGTVGLNIQGIASQTANFLQIDNNTTDANPIFNIDSTGKFNFGAGGASATDTQLFRSAANTISLGTTTSLTAAGILAVDSATTNALTVGNGANAKTITIGNQTGATNLTLQSGSGNINLSPSAGNDVVFSQGAGSNLQLTASAVPTVDQLAISNAGQGVTSAGISGLQITYVGGAAAIEASGARVDLTPGTTSGGTWNGFRIVAAPTGAVTGVAENGIKLEGPTSPGTGTEKAIAITTGWDIGLDIQSGGIQFGNLAANPAAPAAGNLRVYTKLIAGRTMLKALPPSGIDYAYQPSLFQQSVFLVTPGTGTTTTTYSATGGSTTSVGTLNAAIGTPTEAQGFMGNMATGATIGNTAGTGNNIMQYYRGSTANGADGFFFFTRISLPDALAKYANTTTGSRLWFGLTDQANATMVGSDNPAGNYAGVQFSGVRDTASGFFQFITKNGTTQTVQSTGVTLAVSKTYDIYVYCSFQCTTINWRIDNLTDGTAPVEGSQTATLPTATTAMRSGIQISTLEAVAHNMRFQRIYVETDR